MIRNSKSYRPFTENVLKIIKSIPFGKVITYGDIAKLSGSPRAARQVVRILHSLSKKENLPWHRVINSKGEIGFKDDRSRILQEKLLIKEGIVVKSGKVSLSEFKWNAELEF